VPSFFRALIYLYPTAYRQEFGDEMLTVLGELTEEMKERGSLPQLISHFHETGGLLLGAVREHIRNLGLAPDFSIVSQRRLAMRSDFRFPKSTVTLMGIILIAITVAIEKAKAIQQSIPSSHTDVGPIQPAYVSIVPGFLVALAIVSAGGVLLWAVLFVLHRSGIQRFSELNPAAAPPSKSGLFR
jgi:hypothetical protein